jgi:hypothetical protein
MINTLERTRKPNPTTVINNAETYTAIIVASLIYKAINYGWTPSAPESLEIETETGIITDLGRTGHATRSSGIKRGVDTRGGKTQHRTEYTVNGHKFTASIRIAIHITTIEWRAAFKNTPAWCQNQINQYLERAPRYMQDGEIAVCPWANPDWPTPNAKDTTIAAPDLEHHRYNPELTAWLWLSRHFPHWYNPNTSTLENPVRLDVQFDGLRLEQPRERNTAAANRGKIYRGREP